jgi:nucleotide-binding universal stress UspA family protein
MPAAILVPLDGSPFGEHALPHALGLARQHGAPLHLVHVHAPPVPGAYAEAVAEEHARWDREIREQEEAYLARLAARIAEHAGLTAATAVLDGPVVATLRAHAARIDAGLVVLTTHGRGILARSWLGSVTDGLVRVAGTPVLVVRPAEGEPDLNPAPPWRHVVVALDGSALARRVLPDVLALRAPATRISLVSVAPPGRPAATPPPAMDEVALDELAPASWYEADAPADPYEERADVEADRAQTALRAVQEELAATVPETAVRVLRHPSPAVAILDFVRDEGADVVAMTTRGRSGLSRLLLGSVADKVVRGAGGAVLLRASSD